MSMNADIKKDIVSFCKNKNLTLADAIELNHNIMESLEWDDDYDDSYAASEITTVTEYWEHSK